MRIERSRRFYCDLLGLEVVSPEEHNDGPIEMVATVALMVSDLDPP